MRFPRHNCPWVSRARNLLVHVRKVTHRATSPILRHLVLSQPPLERRQRRSLRICLKQPIVLHTLEHDEPVPVFPDKVKTFRDVHALDTFQYLIQRFSFTALCGGDLIFSHNCFQIMASRQSISNFEVMDTVDTSRSSQLGLADSSFVLGCSPIIRSIACFRFTFRISSSGMNNG